MNNESAAVEAVAWLVTNGGETCEPWLVYERNEVEALPASCIADPLYPQSALDALRGEVNRLRAALESVAWTRGPGPMPSRVPGAVVQEMERIAINALTKVTP